MYVLTTAVAVVVFYQAEWSSTQQGRLTNVNVGDRS